MKKSLALVLLIILALCLVCCGKDKEGICISVDEGKSTGGALTGEISLKKLSGEYTLYFGDANGEALQGYTKIGNINENAPYKMEALVIPPDAKTIIVAKDEGGTYFAKIPEEYLLNKENAFIFGALSDIHFNKYNKVAQDDAVVAFDNALDYYEKIGVDMVGITGDLSNDGELSAYTKYNEAISGRSFPVYTVTGNHDYKAYKDKSWQENISANIKGCELAPNGLDFAFYPNGPDGDVFAFLNITFYSYSYFEKSYPVVDVMEQIPWLEGILKAHTDDQVYVFFHLFMCGPDGQSHTGVGNLMNPGGYTYPLPFKKGNSDEKRIRRFFKEYKNVVFFSGHSHWAFEMERYNEETNFSNFDGEYCYMVHIPSVTEPRWIEDEDTERTGKNGELSQGWTIYDYGDTVVLVPVDFLSGTVYTEYMEIIVQADTRE